MDWKEKTQMEPVYLLEKTYLLMQALIRAILVYKHPSEETKITLKVETIGMGEVFVHEVGEIGIGVGKAIKNGISVETIGRDSKIQI
jgi:hypothetical protein